MKATLHDELMRDAGFESDYYAELAHRRAMRRRIARGLAASAVALGLFAGVLLEFGHVSRGAGFTLSVLSLVGLLRSLPFSRKGGD
jgi:hypothetical protein